MFGNQQSMRPNFFDAMQQANIRRKMQIPPPINNPTQSNLPNPSVQSPVAMGMAGLQRPSFMTSGANSQSLYTQRPIGQGVMQQRMANNMSAASRGAGSVPQYINPTGRAIQSQLAQSNQSLAGTLNQRLDRRFDLNPGATAESNVQRQLANGMIPTPNGFQPRQDTSEARNVLAGRPMGEDRTMQPLNIPGMHLEGNRMVKDAPQAIGGANVPARGLGGMTPNQFRNYQEIARRDGGPAGVAAALANGFGADGEENAGIDILNRQAQIMKRNPDGVNTGLSSNYQNVKDSRMARRNGFGSVSSFRNFMNQYNARQNRGTTPLGVASTAGAMATQGLLQGRNSNKSSDSEAIRDLQDTPSYLDQIMRNDGTEAWMYDPSARQMWKGRKMERLSQ